MRTRPAVFAIALAVVLSPAAVFATPKYPPGPSYRSCPDTLTIQTVENPDTLAAPCHPAVADTVLGIRGVVVGQDLRGGAYATYFEAPGGGIYAGVQAFTGATNYAAPVPASPSGGNLVIGDLIAVYGTMQEFPAANGTTEIEGPDVIQSTNDIVIRRVSAGNAVPMNILTTSQLHDLNWLPAFSNGERWEGGLVRVRGPLKVGRTTGTGIQSPNYLLTCNSCGSDSILVDAFTLDPAAPGSAPVVGTVVDSIQGIVNQATSSAGSGSINSYRLQPRTQNDVFLAAPPSLSDAYSTEDNKIRVVFDRNVDPASATLASHYSLASGIDGSVILSAAMETTPGSVVILTISSALSHGDLETLSAQNIGSASCPGCLLTPAQSKSYYHGVMSCAEVQAPDPSLLPSYDDRSRFAGAGTLAGLRITVRGVAIHAFGSVYYIEDAAGGVRSGLAVFAPSTPLIDGHAYRLACAVQEFGSETEAVNTVLVTDEGAVTPPTPQYRSIATLRDTTTDVSQAIETGEDFEGVLVEATNVKVTEDHTAGQSFPIAGPAPGYPDTIVVSNLSGALNGYTPPPSGSTINVIGILHFVSGTFRICPRSSADVAQISTPTFTFNQLGFTSDGGDVDYSDLGEVGLTYTPATNQAFLNIAVRLSGSGPTFWAVRNAYMPDAASAPPVENLSAQFPLYPLGVTIDNVVSQLEYGYTLNPEPINDADSTKWLLGLLWQPPVSLGHPHVRPRGGVGGPGTITIAAAPESIKIYLPFGPPVVIVRSTWIGCKMPNLDLDDLNHPGDWNGCVPAAAANSLRWLGDTHPTQFNLPSDVRSIFTQLSDLMQRMAGEGATTDQVIQAKLDFIEAHRLPIHVKFQSRWIGGNRNSTLGTTTATNENTGGGGSPAWPTREWMESEASHGEDVEVFGGYWYKDGTGEWVRDFGHMVVLTGCGTRNGVPFLTFKDDSTQEKAGGTRQRTSDIVPSPGGGAMTVPGLGGETVVNGVTYKTTFFIESVVSESYDPSAPLPPAQQSFSEYCQWFLRVIPPGGKLRLKFPPGSRCFNVTIYELDRTFSPPNVIKKRVWNFNSGATRVFVNDDTLFCKFIAVHNDDNSRPGGIYTPFTVDVDVLAANVAGVDTPSNPDIFGGFSLGGADGSSGEFGIPAGPNVTVNGSQNCNLIDLPSRLGGGVQQLTLTYPIPHWNPYWSQLELRLTVLSVTTPGNLQVTCPSSGFSGTTAIAAPGTYVVNLGTVPTTANFSITLATQGGLNFTVDAIGIASRVPTPTGVEDHGLPTVAGLWTVGRNPSSGEFAARFDLPQPGRVTLAVFDVAGRRLATLASGAMEAGSHTRTWDALDTRGRRVPAGAYFCRLTVADRTWTVRWVKVN